jgi:hypothetical protein
VTTTARWLELRDFMAEQVEEFRREGDPAVRCAERLNIFVRRAQGFARLGPEMESNLVCTDHTAMIAIGASALLKTLPVMSAQSPLASSVRDFRLALLDVVLDPTLVGLERLEVSVTSLHTLLRTE